MSDDGTPNGKSASFPHLDAAEEALDAGNLEEAESHYRRHLMAHPNDAYAHNRLGVCLVRDGRLREAATAFEEAIRHDARMARAYTNLGNLRLEAGDLEEAEKLHRQALDIDPDLAYAWENLAAVLKRQRRIGEAVAAQKKAAKLHARRHREEAREDLRVAQQRGTEKGKTAAEQTPWMRYVIWGALALLAYYLWQR